MRLLLLIGRLLRLLLVRLQLLVRRLLLLLVVVLVLVLMLPLIPIGSVSCSPLCRVRGCKRIPALLTLLINGPSCIVVPETHRWGSSCGS